MNPILSVAIIGDAKKLVDALDQSADKVQGFGAGLGTLAKGAAVAGVVTGVAVAIGEVTSAAAADAQEQARLEQAIQASGAAIGDWQEQTDAAITAGQNLAFTDTEIRDALVPLVAQSGDVAQATQDLALAQDVARFKGIDLASAAEAVAKAQEGSNTQLARMLGINAEGMTSTDLLAEAQRRAAGQAETYAGSTAGGLERMKIMFDEVAETVGSAFLPILEEILPELMPLVEEIAELAKELLPILIPLLRLVATVFIAIARAITQVMRQLRPLLEALGEVMDLISEFANARSGGLFDIPALGGTAAGTAALAGGGGSTITVYTGADPASVVRALRQYAGENGGASPTAIRAYGG